MHANPPPGTLDIVLVFGSGGGGAGRDPLEIGDGVREEEELGVGREPVDEAPSC